MIIQPYNIKKPRGKNYLSCVLTLNGVLYNVYTEPWVWECAYTKDDFIECVNTIQSYIIDLDEFLGVYCLETDLAGSKTHFVYFRTDINPETLPHEPSNTY